MPKPIIKKQTISVDVEFEAGDRLRYRSVGRIYVVVYVDDNHMALVHQHEWFIKDGIVNVTWFSHVDNQDLKKFILGSELAKALYGGQGTIADLVNEFMFDGYLDLEQAIAKLPTKNE